jgi:hypothetical protein
LPEGLSPEDERAALSALERYFAERDPRPDAWALAGRLDATGIGALQARALSRKAWRAAGRSTFVRRGTEPIRGRGDTA